MILLILNWFFEITPYQKLQGLPLMITPYINLFGFVLGIVSIEKSPNRYGKLGIICHSILFLLPFLYWYLGSFFLGV